MTMDMPSSTYRLQFNQNFTFKDAMALVPYLSQLGISHCYASPLLTARPGSTHGYDIIDHRHLNPEIGTEEDFNLWMDALHEHHIGLILDIVPNHMGIGEDNGWWMDVLEYGAASRYAEYFDIDWSPLKTELAGKVLLPVLGEAYGAVLEQGELQVRFNAADGNFTIHYYDNYWPVTPQSYPLILRQNLDHLRQCLNQEAETLPPATRGSATSPDNRSTSVEPSQGNTLLATESPTFSMVMLEYESILRSFEQLPPHSERDPQLIQARDHEVTVAKHRLSSLCQENPLVQEFLDETLLVYNSSKTSRESQDLMHQLLESQVYRLAYWRVAGEEINYRRFFDINSLAGIRVENPTVFHETHELILRLVQQGKVQGLRIDHPDGLFDPASYFKRLQTEANQALKRSLTSSEGPVEGVEEPLPKISESFSSIQKMAHKSTFDAQKTYPFYILAEKILAPYETLPSDWAIQGTTGYDFIYSMNELFVQSASDQKMTKIYQRFTGKNESFSDILLDCKRLTLKVSLASELNVLAYQLNRLSESDRRSRDYTLNGLRRALGEIIIAFPVYRTYLDEQSSSAKDREYVEWAVNVAKKRSTGVDLGIFDFIRHLLLADLSRIRPSINFQANNFQGSNISENAAVQNSGSVSTSVPSHGSNGASNATENSNLPISPKSAGVTNTEEDGVDEFLSTFEGSVRRFAMKFQQLTGPVMAKSMEDTAFYRYNRFISLNEVGGQPELFGISISAFHRKNLERAQHWPYSMLASSTHDTKRSEDVRARLNVISEIPKNWHYSVTKWRRINHIHKTMIDDEAYPCLDDEYLLYQTICGIYPLGVTDWSDEQIATDIKSRLKIAMQKAVREAKVYTSWINPNEAYENALFNFIDKMLNPDPQNLFHKEFLAFINMVSRIGYFNTLSQLVLKLTSPGIPDIYQGMELHTFSLVDPDNRRPVDFGKRIHLLEALMPLLACQEEDSHLQRIAQLFSSYEAMDSLKLYMTAAILQFRKAHPTLFAQGTYVPMTVYGEKAEQLIVFRRQVAEKTVLVLTTRFWASSLSLSEVEADTPTSITPFSIRHYDWKDTQVETNLEEDFHSHTWKELFTGKKLVMETGLIAVSQLLPIFPVSIWVLQ